MRLKVLLVSLFFTPVSLLAESLCSVKNEVHTSQIVDQVSQFCCHKTKGLKSRTCLSRQVRRTRLTSKVFGREFSRKVKVELRALQKSQCKMSGSLKESLASCDSAPLVSVQGVTSRAEELACDKRFSYQRKNTLRRLKRQLKRIQKTLPQEFFNSALSSLKRLRTSDACGGGGEEAKTGCQKIVDPRDRLNEENVYKIHNNLPLFITHDSNASGVAISRNGKRVAEVSYTGLNNPDARGLRHHYVVRSVCTNLPKRYYIKLGTTCYDIDTPCERID